MPASKNLLLLFFPLRWMLLFCLTCVLVPYFAMATEPVTRFERFSLDDGLSQSTITGIIQDNKGFLWFATEDGLNRYDGYDFKVYRHNGKNRHSLGGNFIRSMMLDSQGLLWIGSDSGLSRFDTQTERFEHFQRQSGNPNSLSNNRVRSLFEDTQGNLWVGTGQGLNRFNRKSRLFEQFLHQPSNPNSLSHNSVYTIYQDSSGALWVGTRRGLNRFDYQSQTITRFEQKQLAGVRVKALTEDTHGNLWIGTNKGLNRYNRQSGLFSSFNHIPSSPGSLSHKYVQSVFVDSSGLLWVGTKDGLNRFDSQTQQFKRFKFDRSNPNSLSNNTIFAIYEDSDNVIWIGSQTGLNKYNTATRYFNHVNPSSLGGKLVSSFHEDSNNRIWVGTWGAGLSLYNDKTLNLRTFRHEAGNPNSLSHNRVQSILRDSQGRLWVGTLGGGLNLYDEQNARFIHFKHNKSDPNSLSHNTVTAVHEDKKGTLWVATLGGGLNRYDPQNNHFEHIKTEINVDNSLSSNNIITLYEDDQGVLWLGTWDRGLNSFDPHKNLFKHYRHNPDISDTLSSDSIQSINEDELGNLWIGTTNGLNRFDRKNRNFTRLLPNEVINGIVSVDSKQLWLSTNRGLTRFNPLSTKISNYDVKDGVQGTEFLVGAAFRRSNGEVFFGGAKGFNRFYPKQIKATAPEPAVVLTDFLLFNKSVPIALGNRKTDNRYRLPKPIEALNQLELAHRQNLITFEFAGLNFVNPKKIQYAYKLENWDQDWIYTSAKNRRATFTNIPAGQYTLHLKATNPFGHWNEQKKSLKIVVHPPLWNTWWAYLIYLLAGLWLIWFQYRQNMQKRLKALEAQHKKIQRERALNQQLKQVDKLKDEFLANTSHELRTPLNGIIGLAESLVDGVAGQLPAKANHNLSMVIASGKRLNNLVNDILDFSKLKNHNLKLNTKPVDLYPLVEVVLALSRPIIGKKDLLLVNDIPADLPTVLADEDRLQQILHNLSGNAIKFTDSGQITVSAQVNDNQVTISVCDTGIGIEPDKQAQIFDSFEQIESHSHRASGGTGLGLAICKQLVTLHGGHIEVASQPGQGCVFSFTLPICYQAANGNISALETVARLHQIPTPDIDYWNDDEAIEQKPMDPPQSKSSNDNSRFKILLVDDEPVNLQVLHDHLSLLDYQLVEASSGQQALALLRDDETFDLVLLDIMMPQISGYEVCRQLREEYSVNDLPVIFLTAKTQVTDLVQSFAVGANDYLTKPVTKHELLARVETHLKLLDINRNLELKVSQRTQQLVQAEKMASLGTLTDGFAHEINNPNNFIYVGTQNLMADLRKLEKLIFDLAGDEADRDVIEHLQDHFEPLFVHLETIGVGTHRIKGIVEDLQTFTQRGSGDIKTVDICENLQSTINLVQTKHLKVIEFVTDFVSSPLLLCYPAQLNQAFMHLITNGCEAIVNKQRTTEHPDTANKHDKNQIMGQITVSCRQLDNAIEIIIKDNGCGMEDESIKQLFDPFYTTKAVGKGTGLGLSVTYNIIRQHRGELNYTSTPGVGTVCTLLLPIS